MSSTNRGNIRHISDYYVTPVEQIKLFLNALIQEVPDLLTKKGLAILDPCAGGDSFHNMSYSIALQSFGFDLSNLTTIDIREDSHAQIKVNYLQYLNTTPYDIVITNPPFSHALPIIRKAFLDAKPEGYVIMLLRLNFFGSQIRFPFWKEHLPKYCFVHHKRMSFTDDGGTDSIEYVHAVWQVGNKVDFTKLKVI